MQGLQVGHIDERLAEIGAAEATAGGVGFAQVGEHDGGAGENMVERVVVDCDDGFETGSQACAKTVF